MIQSLEKIECCGCGACEQICPKQCISMAEDAEGFLYPVIDYSACVDCHKCEKVYPMLNKMAARKPEKVVAARNLDEGIRKDSSSGGVFTLLAEQIIAEGGVVFGVRFNKRWEVVCGWTDTIEELKDFSAVSVREKDGVKISKDIFGVNAQLVLDPTLLSDRSFYECQLLSNKVVISNNKVVSIMLSQPELSVLQMKWAKKRGLLHIDLSNTFYDCRDLKNHTEFHWQHVTVQRWLEEIRSARYVITNSFHATIFCLLFEKQFVTLNLIKGGTNRIETLLSYVGLEYLGVHDMKEMDSIIELPIDYVSVHEKLNNLRRKSLCFLDEALK